MADQVATQSNIYRFGELKLLIPEFVSIYESSSGHLIEFKLKRFHIIIISM